MVRILHEVPKAKLLKVQGFLLERDKFRLIIYDAVTRYLTRFPITWSLVLSALRVL